MVVTTAPEPPLYSEEELALLIDGMASNLECEMEESISRNPKTAVATAALAGFLDSSIAH